MANWCFNCVEINGEENNIKACINELEFLRIRSEADKEGVRPSDVGDLQYMFNIDIEDSYFSFESKWVPANNSLNYLAKKHDVEIYNHYEELGCDVYGLWVGTKDTEEDYYLTSKEIDLVKPVDEDENSWMYDEEEFECKEDALEIILTHKVENKHMYYDTKEIIE